FITVEQMQNSISNVSKGRELFREVYRFQVGLNTNSVAERSKLQDAIRRWLKQDKIELLSATKPGEKLGYFYANITAEVPMT
ncbi:hypothetical protein DEM28_28650, partial [Enterobacter mori]